MIPSETTIQLARKEVVAIFVKHGLFVIKNIRNSEFNIITDKEALAVDIELSNNQYRTLETIY